MLGLPKTHKIIANEQLFAGVFFVQKFGQKPKIRNSGVVGGAGLDLGARSRIFAPPEAL